MGRNKDKKQPKNAYHWNSHNNEISGKAMGKTIVTGDGFTSQEPPIAHFGLGKIKNVSEIQVQWPTGEVQTLQSPAINQYHQIEYKESK